MDRYGIDSHKLMYHPRRVADWLEGKKIWPLYLEVGPVGRCNHRCVFCAFDYSGYDGPRVETVPLKRVLADGAERGVKAVMFAGEGEPLLHPDIVDLVQHSRSTGLDVSITTNGVLFDREMAQACLKDLSWIRFSLDAADPETYAQVHGCKSEDFDTVLRNIKEAVSIKNVTGARTTIGVQALFLPQNQFQMEDLARMVYGLGADYLIIKPFSKHPSSKCSFSMSRSEMLSLKELERLSTDTFSVIVRTHATEKIDQERGYERCLALPFATYIDCHGDVYACSAFLGNPNFVYGNIRDGFPTVWASVRRALVRQRVVEMGVEPCREICRLDEMNRYLWALKCDPPPHVNFI